MNTPLCCNNSLLMSSPVYCSRISWMRMAERSLKVWVSEIRTPTTIKRIELVLRKEPVQWVQKSKYFHCKILTKKYDSRKPADNSQSRIRDWWRLATCGNIRKMILCWWENPNSDGHWSALSLLFFMWRFLLFDELQCIGDELVPFCTL